MTIGNEITVSNNNNNNQSVIINENEISDDSKVWGDITISDIKESSIGNSNREVLLAKFSQKQIKDIDAKYSNTRALSQLTLATDRLNNTQESAKAALEVTGGTDPEQEAAGARLKALGQESEVLKKVTDLLKLSDKDLLAVNRSSTKDNDTILTQALTKLAPLIQGLFGKLGSQAKLGEERRDIPFKQALGEVSEASKPALAALKVEREGLALQVQELANTQSVTGAYNSILEKRKNVLDIAEVDNKFSELTIGITENITKSALVSLKAKAEGK